MRLLLSCTFTLFSYQILLSCSLSDLTWVENPDCIDCIKSVQIIQSEGNSYVAFFGDDLFCADALTVLYDCNGAEICLQGGLFGYTQCDSILLDYEVVETLWDQGKACCVDECIRDVMVLCPDVYEPVCGCDGVTYWNDCVASNYAGVTSFTSGACTCDVTDLDWLVLPSCDDCISSVDLVSYEGEMYIVVWADPLCPDAFISTLVYTCSGTLICSQGDFGNGSECPDFFISYRFLSRLWDSSIACCVDESLINEEIACLAVFDPVCGCDGNTYGNSCKAMYYAGITSWTAGACGTCLPEDLHWLELPDCDGCVLSIRHAYVNGKGYIVATGDDAACEDAVTTVYNCCGVIVCQEESLPGTIECVDLLMNALMGDFIWKKALDCCPSTIDLGPIDLTSSTHHAEISVRSSSHVLAQHTVQFKAGQEIELLNGFSVLPNAQFLAVIEACD